VSETEQAAAIASYVDLRQVTLAEVQAIADEEGLTLTDALAATYVGQGVAENYAAEKLSAARAEYDPLATTLAEATEFFANTGYSATPEEIAQFVASKTEETQTSAIGAYVDPRQVTAAEAEEFLSAIGYQPSQADIDQFTGQLNDENYQVAQKAAINEYVDPRFFSASEARAAYEELGLVDVTQEDVDRFVGQFDPESEDYDPAGFEAFQRERLRTYLPTATFNLISKTVGSPSVADDPNTPEDESKEATGIYKAIEEGSAKDVALQEAIDALSTNLGLTETEVLKQLGTTKEDLEKSIGDIETSLGEDISDLAGVIGTPAVEDDPDTLDVDETQDPTGIFADIADLVASGSTRDEAIQTIADNLGTTKSDLETAIANIDVTEQITSVIGTELGTPATDDAEATGIFADIADLVASGSTRDEAIQTIADNLGTTKSDLETAISTVETSLGEDITNLAGVIGTPATDDAEATGIFADIADLVASGSTRDEAIQTIANNLGTTKTDLETAIGAVETSLGEGITDIADILGTPEVLDDPNTLDVDESQDPTGLFATVKQYENSGVERDEALSLAIGDVSTALGTTETNLLNTIGTTKDDLLAIIGAPATDDTAATGIYASIDEGLGALSNDIASIIGKPAQNVTQVDIDFIADTIAQDQVLSELQIQQYDVTGDGIVNNADLNLLQQAFAGQDVQLADTSMFTPATGLYGTIDTQQQTIQDLQSQIDAQTALNTELNTNLNTQLNTLINTQQAQQEAAKRQQQQQGLMQLAAAARGVKVTPPDPFQLKYMYDIGGESIFATPTQESLFTSPYDTRRQATGFLSGGMVEDETDALLRILGG
jgi:predicted RNase H-like HicB family nuclease